MAYAVKEIYFTLQGEGAHSGRPTVFCRFTGCNLWSGRQRDRSKAVCQFCDTDFVGTDGPGGGRFDTPEQLAEAIAAVWLQHVHTDTQRFVVCTGGEPLLQLDQPAVRALHDHGFTVAVETNGTILPPEDIDWICVSPKAHAELVVRRGDELKLVYPQAGVSPEDFVDLPFEHFFLQPLDGTDLAENLRGAIRYCLRHPPWRLSIQMHKMLGFHENATITDAYRVAFVPWPGSNQDHDYDPSGRYLYQTQDANAACNIDAVQRTQAAAGITSP
jgi:7-carboxy-7-deazaguanine synthase